MSNSLTIAIDSETISITAENGSVLSRTSTLLALDQNGQVVSIGKSFEELNNQRNIRILNPFAVEHFHPKLAATMISKLANSAMVLLTEPNEDESRKPMTMNWYLQIPRYEHLNRQVQESFEYYTQRLPKVRIKSLTINNQPKPIQAFQRATRAIMIGLGLTISSSVLLVGKVLQVMMPEQLTKPLTILEVILFAVVSIGFMYLMGFVYMAVCKASLRNIIPAPVYKDMIEDSDLSPEKLFSWLRDKLSFGQHGG